MSPPKADRSSLRSGSLLGEKLTIDPFSRRCQKALRVPSPFVRASFPVPTGTLPLPASARRLGGPLGALIHKFDDVFFHDRINGMDRIL